MSLMMSRFFLFTRVGTNRIAHTVDNMAVAADDMFRLSAAAAAFPKWSRIVIGGSLVVFARFFWLSEIDLPPSELELSWLETESGLRRFVESDRLLFMALSETCSRSKVGVFPSKTRKIFFFFLTCSGTLRWRGSGDLHIPEVQVLIKSLIKKNHQERAAHWKKRPLRTVSESSLDVLVGIKFRCV